MAKPSPKTEPKPSATMSAAAQIDHIQKQQRKNTDRMGVLMNEHSKLFHTNSELEIQRQEALREFDKATR